MNAIVVDTSVWISYFRASEQSESTVETIERGLSHGAVFLPSIVICELLSGRLTRARRLELQSFLLELPRCDAAFEHWVRVGELRARAASKGLAISSPDAHVAQSALDLDAVLLSEDQIFKKLAKFEDLKLG